MLRILHLSDIHYQYEKKIDMHNFIVPSLNKIIEEAKKEKEIDLIVITGDLIDKGGKNFPKGCNPFEEFKKNFLDLLVFENHKIIFAPGNHDIVRSADKVFTENGIKGELNTIEKTNNFILNVNENNDLDGIKRIELFKNFEREYHKENTSKISITNFQSNYNFVLNGYNVSLTAFNSAWRCYDSDNDYGNILLGENQITDSRSYLEGSDIKIALMHHSLDCFSKFENVYLNFIEKDYDILLTGHLHTGSNSSVNSGSGGIIRAIAPGNWTDNIRAKDSTVGCLIVDYNKTNSEVLIHHKKYFHSKETFEKDTSQGNSDGIQKFDIINTEIKFKYMEEFENSKKMMEKTEDTRNSHLLSYNTNSTAPKDLESIFVMPNLVKKSIKANENLQEVKEEKYDIKKIMEEDRNFIILGGKEAGKTVLLDRIFVEYNKQIKKYHLISVYVDINEVTTKIETKIAQFLNVSLSKLESFLDENKIILLIDNLSFDNEQNKITKNIDDFISSHNKIKVIATVATSLEGSTPLSLFNFYNNFKDFKLVNIEGFKTKEIKELIRKWFNSNDQYYKCDEKIESILNFFKTLNIPTTPLSISMFLWLIEKQENYKPINKASMLQDFLDKMFIYEKEGVRTYYTDDFDLNNNERLLANLTQEMFNKDNENYRMEYNEALIIIGKHLSSRKFDFKSDDLLKNYLNKGILIKEYVDGQNYVRFRFNCFFEYFLAKQMVFVTEFKDFVIAKENYLFFFNVIDYYTGIKRDEDSLLEEFLKRMNNKYQDLFEKFLSMPCGLDTVFENASKRIACNTSLESDIIPLLSAKEVEKPSAEELEAVSDDIIDSISYENKIEKKDKKLSQLLELERSWTIPAMILRNSDEVHKDNLKINAYTQILQSSIVFCSIYKLMIDDYIDRRKKEDKLIEESILDIQNLLPLLHQILLHTIIGTNKLSIIIKEKIDLDFHSLDSAYTKTSGLKQIKNNKTLSDLEKFMSVFIFCDIKKDKDSLKNVKHLIGSIRNKGIYDMILFKLITYYYFRAKSPDEEKDYENLIADLLIKANSTLTNNDKTTIINNYKEAKKGHLLERED